MLEESVWHSSSAVSCKDYFHLGINLLVAVTDNPAFRLQTNHSFNETRNNDNGGKQIPFTPSLLRDRENSMISRAACKMSSRALSGFSLSL